MPPATSSASIASSACGLRAPITHSPADIPLLRRKLDAVIEHFGLPPQSHDAKAVVNVIETFPRDELFQMSTAELIPIVRGIVNLYERRRVRLFVRRDSYGRFYSCLVYVPRDRYNTEVRERIERIVKQRFGGTDVESQVQISDSALARLHLLVRTPQGMPRGRRHRLDRGGDRGRGRNLGRPPAAGAGRRAAWRAMPSNSRIDMQECFRRPIATRSSPRRRSRTSPTWKRSRPIPPCRSSTCDRTAGGPANHVHLRILRIGRPDSDLRHPAHARELRAAGARGTQLLISDGDCRRR